MLEWEAGERGLGFDRSAPAPKASTTRTVVRMTLAGANPAARVEGLEPLPGRANYLVGSDPQRWRTNIARYARVEYRDVYPGVSLSFHRDQRQLEYDFTVSPGADPSLIRLGFEGIDGMHLDGRGDLVLGAGGIEIRQHRPRVYQEIGGVKREVAGSYLLKGAREAGFHVGVYDRTRPLVIDPVVTYSTYLGGSGDPGELGLAIALDGAGNIYLTGFSSSADFPSTAGSYQTALGGGFDAFVTKLDATGTALVYSTYLGGSGFDQGHGIAVDEGGNAYVAGSTTSADFPTTAGAFRAANAGGLDGFVTKLNAAGTALVYSTYLGGSGSDTVRGIRVYGGGEAYVTGFTGSVDYPITPGALQTTNRGGMDAFVSRLHAAGSSVLYSTYLGGSGPDRAFGIAVDGQGNAYVAGSTESSDFPTTAGAAQTVSGGGLDAFVAKINAAGSGLVYSTYLGGSSGEEAWGIAVDASGAAYLTGYTASSNFPATGGVAQGAKGGGLDAFVAKVDAGGSALAYASFLGGARSDFGESIAVDGLGSAYVTGATRSINFPKSADASQPAYGGGDDAFVLKLNAGGTEVAYGSYLGGSAEDRGLGIAVDGCGRAWVTGFTSSVNFPTTPEAFQKTYGGAGSEGFLIRVGESCSDLVISKTASPNPVAPGSDVTYTIGVANLGPDAASSVTVTDNLPSSTTFVSCSSTGSGVCGGSGNSRTVTFPSLAAGAAVSITLVATVNGAVPNGTVIANTAAVTSSGPDPSQSNNAASATTTAVVLETVSTPSAPSGPGSGTTGTVYTYSVTGAASSLGHSLRYLFDWGDGTDSGWLAAGTTSATKSWSAGGTYSVRAKARCAIHDSVVSGFSASLSVSIQASLYSIAGRVVDAGGNPIGGVTMALSGTQSKSAQTNSSGNYSFSSLPGGGNYTVTPSKTNFTFTPSSQTFNNLSANQTANFTGPVTYTIGGQVTDASGKGIAWVGISLSGSQSGSTSTGSAGSYVLRSVVAGGNYTVKPAKGGYTFSPASQTFTAVGGNQTANFTGTALWIIGGRVVDAGGNPISGVTMTLSGGRSKSTQTNSSGDYNFYSLPEGGNYTVTPSKTNFTFTPASQTFNNLSGKQTANFTGPVTYSISGRIADVGGKGIASVSVALSGSQSGSTSSDSAGSYVLRSLVAGGNYTVKPAKGGYAFTPASQAFNGLAANRTANFTGTPLWTIGGRVVDAGGNPISGVTMTLSGGQSKSTQTNSSGNYSFSNLPGGGNYTVTPSKAGLVFTPASQSFNNLGGNQTANFTGRPG